MLHPTNHFLDREVFDLLVNVPLIFLLCQECSVNMIYGLVYLLQCIGRLDSSYQYRLSGIKSEYIGLFLIL